MTRAAYLSRAAMHMRLNYYENCVGWSPSDVHVRGGLCDMIADAKMITRKTFLRHVNREHLAELESQLAYESHPRRGLTMAGDWHVAYYRSKLHGKTVYYFQHSHIEYVFAREA